MTTRFSDVQKTSSADVPLIDVRAVAEHLNCSTRHVYRLVERGVAPPPLKVGGLNRWSRQRIEEWIAGGCQPVGKSAEPVATADGTQKDR